MAGFIVTILGGKDGQGKSQIAANLCYAYAEQARGKVLLLDFDQRSLGDQNFITGIKSKKTIKDIGDFSGAIDPRSIMQFVTVTPQNISYVSMPQSEIEANSINVEGIGRFLKTTPQLYPLTIIDVGSLLNPLTLKALEFSTLIFLVVTPDILALNQTKRMYDSLTTMLFPKDMIQVILNQAQKNHPVSMEVVGKIIGKITFASIDRDDQTCTIALNKKKPIMLISKNSPFSKGITDLVRKMIGKNILKVLEKLNKSSSSKMIVKDTSQSQNPWKELKERIHKALIDEMDLKQNDNKDPKAQLILKEKTKKIVVDLLNKEDTKSILKNREEMGQIVKEIIDEALGLGPLEDLLSDSLCSEIMVVGPNKIFFEYDGKIKLSKIQFTNDRQVLNVIERIVAPIGRRIDEKTPFVDARLSDGSRVHAIIPPSSLTGCTVTIRKFPENRLTYKDLVKFDSLNQNMADFLRIAVEGKRNIVVSGGTGSGKTTLINILGSFIPSNERIITCEDSAELDFPQEHVVSLETRPPSLEGDGEIDIRLLVKQTLRMRPDRIIVGECRGGETLDMLQAMGTGHDGSMTTVHSNNPRECIGRLETLVQYAGTSLSPKAIKEMIVASVHLIIQQSRLDDGTRRITYITEIGGMQGDIVTLQDIFIYQQKGFNKEGKIEGEFQCLGFIPKFIETMEKRGINIPRGLFQNMTKKAPPPPPPPASPPKRKIDGQKPQARPMKRVLKK